MQDDAYCQEADSILSAVSTLVMCCPFAQKAFIKVSTASAALTWWILTLKGWKGSSMHTPSAVAVSTQATLCCRLGCRVHSRSG